MALRDRRASLAVAFVAIVGLIFAVAGNVLVSPAIPNEPLAYASVETFLVIVALGLEHLVGNDVRALAGMRRT